MSQQVFPGPLQSGASLSQCTHFPACWAVTSVCSTLDTATNAPTAINTIRNTLRAFLIVFFSSYIMFQIYCVLLFTSYFFPRQFDLFIISCVNSKCKHQLPAVLIMATMCGQTLLFSMISLLYRREKGTGANAARKEEKQIQRRFTTCIFRRRVFNRKPIKIRLLRRPI